MTYMIGVDVGGTFTDFTLVNDRTKELKFHKVPSTPSDPSIAIMNGIKEVLEQNDIPKNEIRYMAHGTTVATNALIERKGAKTVLITTKGFRDLLEIGRQTRPSLYDLFAQKPETVVPPERCIEVNERILASGAVLKEIDKDELNDITQFIEQENIQAVSICLLFSYLNPVHEQVIAQAIKQKFPNLYVSVSHEIVPEFREYSRMSTTVLNAYLGPIMKDYMGRFLDSVRKEHIPVDPYITQSNGGIISINESIEKPILTAVSGPSAGVMAAKNLAGILDLKNIITFDMGGTSADISLIEGGEPKISMEREVEHFPARIPMLDIQTCGAGGGSIAYIDAGGALKVGPQSAGSIPGPAAYGRGGTNATVTDANAVLGRLNPKTLLGGRMRMDIEAAKQTIKEQISKKANLSLEKAAAGILEVVNANMAREIRLVSIQKGYDPRQFTLISFGGAGGLHCAALAKELHIPKVIIPLSAGTFCSFGLLVSDIRSDLVRTKLMDATVKNMFTVEQLFDQLKTDGQKFLFREKISEENQLFGLTIDVRFKGQNYEIAVPVTWEEVADHNSESINAKFFDYHEKKYGYSRKDGQIEYVNYRLAAIGKMAKADFPEIEQELKTPKPLEVRQVYFSEAPQAGYYETPVFARETLYPSIGLEGPMIIEQMDTTTMVLPGQKINVDVYGNIIIDV